MLYGVQGPPQPTADTPLTNVRLIFSFSYQVIILWVRLCARARSLPLFLGYPCCTWQVIVAIVSGIIMDNLGNLRDLRSAIADDLESRCFICNIDRCVRRILRGVFRACTRRRVKHARLLTVSDVVCSSQCDV